MKKALEHLARDTRFGPLVRRFGKAKLREKDDVFHALVRSIIYQQVTGKAAAAIFARFVALFPGNTFPTPKAVSRMPVEKLRSAGLSGQKASYIHDLASKFADGTVRPDDLPRMSNDEVITHLTQVKGIGVWTSHMFLIFTLGRLDVLPTGDLGIQKGFKVLYGLRSLPTQNRMEALAKPWRQYASVASWYLWKVADEDKEKFKKKN
jgi:DNA-3-methyladenine glycosylase II